jgi:adenosine deaminase
VRIGHGLRCVEDPALMRELYHRQIPLEICPSSNVCLKVVPRLEDHPLPHLLDAGLVVTLNSDDPPMFNTTLTEEYLRTAHTFHFGGEIYEKLVLNALEASFLSAVEKKVLEARLQSDFEQLQAEL